RRAEMAKFHVDRREALKRMGFAAAAGFAPSLLASQAARAADVTVGFVYIGPRNDWGWNQSFAVAGAALKGAGVKVIEAGYLPESTDYGSGKETPETRAYAEAMKSLVADGAGMVVSTSFDEDPFLLAVAKKNPSVMFRQASLLAHPEYPPNVGSQNALINQG